MATFYGFSGGDNFTNGTTGNDLFLTVGGGDYVQSTAGNDTFNLGYVKSALYWRYTFNDSDTVDYRYTWQSYGFAADTGLKIVVDLQAGTVQKLLATGTLLNTDTLIGVDAIYGTAGADTFHGRSFWDFDLFYSSRGGDVYDGRGGADGVSYQNIESTNGIEVVLAAGQVQWKDGLYTDTLRQIEWIRGTNFADTYDATGYGGTSMNMNSSGESWNLYNPGAGDDTIIGNGQTILNYGTSLGGAVRVDLSLQTSPTTSAGIITAFTDDPATTGGLTPGSILASGVSSFRAGNYNDTLRGGGHVNTDGASAAGSVSGDLSFEAFRGNGGNDFIDGRTGFDRAEYNVGDQMQGITVRLAAGTVVGDALTGSDRLRGIESIASTFMDDVYDARGFTLSSAAPASRSVNSGDVRAILPVDGETLASDAFNEFRAYAGNDTVIGNGATRISFSGILVEKLSGARPSVEVVFTSADDGSASYGNTDGGFGTVTFSGVRSAIGGVGDDRLVGSSAYQGLRGYYGNDTLIGGSGNDWLTGHNGESDSATNLSTTYTDNDSLDGGAGNDELYGEFGNDTLVGGTGNDLMRGGTGNDRLDGGAGNDQLIGGSGSDRLIGGAGNDSFYFNSKVGKDTATDFNSAADTFRFSQAGLRVGDGDTTVDGFTVRNVSGGFSAATEVVAFTPNVAGGVISAASAAAVIGTAASNFATGATRLFVVDNGADSGIFLFTSSALNAQVSASELTQIATFNGPASAASDYVFVA